MRWLLPLFLCGCPYGDMVSISTVDPSIDVEPENGLDCAQALDAVDTVLQGEGWDLAEPARPVWTPEVEYLGEARVYALFEAEVLIAASEDHAVASDWSDGHPTACPVRAYEQTCDEAWCGDAVEAPCAHLLQVPCHVAWDPDWYRIPTLAFLRDVE